MTRRTHPKPEVVRLQVRIRKTTMDELQEMADADLLPISALVRRVLDGFVASESKGSRK